MTNLIVMDGIKTSRIYEQVVVFGDCYTCGLPIAMTRSQRRQFDEHGATMWCSQGHQTVRMESDVQKLERQLKEAQDRTTSTETQRDNYIKLLDVEVNNRRKLEKRSNAGVCSKCHRTFRNVQRHMVNKH